MPYKIPALANKPYRPSNGTEGDIFMSEFCFQCQVFNICKILKATFAYDIDHPKYPKTKWVHDDEGWPLCKSFVSAEEVKLKKRHKKRDRNTMEMFT